MLVKNVSRRHFEIFFLFSQKTGFDNLYKLHMKCHLIFIGFDISCKLGNNLDEMSILFSGLRRQFAWNVKSYFVGKNKKNNITLLSAELAFTSVRNVWCQMTFIIFQINTFKNKSTASTAPCPATTLTSSKCHNSVKNKIKGKVH